MTTERDLIQQLAETLAEEYGVQREFDDGEPLLGSGAIELLSRTRAFLSQPEPEGPPLEPRGCPTPGACSCPTSPTVPPDLIRALELAEAALADISDAGCFQREPGDDLAQAEARAAQDLPRIREALARWGRAAIESETNGQA
jgi:hypothetical protein